MQMFKVLSIVGALACSTSVWADPCKFNCAAIFTLVNSAGGQGDESIVIRLGPDGTPATELGKALLERLTLSAKENPRASIMAGTVGLSTREAAAKTVVDKARAHLNLTPATAAKTTH